MNVLHDLNYAFRTLLQKPAFALSTIMIMALGIGMCIFNYSFIYGSSFRDLPLPTGDRLRGVYMSEGQFTNFLPTDVFLAMREQQTQFEMLSAMEFTNINVSGSGYAMRYESRRVLPDMFAITAMQPVMGRAFTEADTVADAKPVAVISHKMWQTYLGGRGDVIGATIIVDGIDTEVIGVMPALFRFPMNLEIWLPLRKTLDKVDAGSQLEVYGILKPDASSASATRELADIYQRFIADDPERNRNTSPRVYTYQELSMQGIGGVLIAMSAAVVFILLLSCVNVANLLFSRASERAKETAIRVALGAPTARLILQMMLESTVICFVGGVIAILLAQVMLDFIGAYLNSAFRYEAPYFWIFDMDAHLLAVSVGIIAFTAVVTGILPAWKILSGDLNAVLRDGTRGAQSRQSSKVNKALVVFEVAISCALLTASAMVAIGNDAAEKTDYGVNPENFLVARVGLPETRYPTPESQTLFFEQLIDDLNSHPGVDLALGVNPLPGQGAYYRGVEMEGFEKTRENQYPQAYSAEVMPGAFEALDVSLLKGRHFERSDDVDAEKVAIVTSTFVEQVLNNDSDVIGRRVRYATGDDGKEHPWMTIVGVVEHVVQGQPYMPGKMFPSVFTPMAQNQWREMSVVLRGGDDPYAMREPLRAVLRKLDANVPIYLEYTYEHFLKQNVAGFEFISNLFSLFAAVSLVLAASGIYAVIANAVQLRNHELAVRRALGAQDQDILRMLMRQGWLQLAIGFVIGLPIAYVMGNTMLQIIGNTGALVYAMYLVIPAMIAAVVMLATYVPAKRAVSCEPTVALRNE